ncbi:TolC family protein [Vibrio cholerae]|nr:TolC family protein [Vibrio cholerae]
MKKLIILSSSFFASFSVHAVSYQEYIALVYENAISVKIAKHSVEAEKSRMSAREYYYMPTFTASTLNKTEHTTKDVNTNTQELNLNVNSQIYASDVKHKIDEYSYKVDDALNTVQLEREKLNAVVLKNLISIHYYQGLKEIALDLQKQAEKIVHKIKVQRANGTASENDVNRATLLVSRIENEINLVDKQIRLSESNIEAATGQIYPEDGIQLDSEFLGNINRFNANEDLLYQNLTYKGLELKRKSAKSLALQQDPFFSLNASGVQALTYADDLQDESNITLTASVNVFDYAKKQEKKAQFQGVEAARLKMELKYFELKNNDQTYKLLEKSFLSELDNLQVQIVKNQELVSGSQSEYAAGKVSLYEMLNTRFDLFSIFKQRADVKIEFSMNKIDMMINSGQL